MAEINVVKQSGYSLISNYHLKDRRLSWGAKGLLTAVLALSGEEGLAGLIYNKRFISGIGDMIEELERYGYLIREQTGHDGAVDPETGYTVYERPIAKEPSGYPVGEIPNVEDVPGRILHKEDTEEEKQIRFRESLKLEEVAKKCTSNFVETVFIELGWRDVEFRQMMTAKAFESVCLEVWERQRSETNRSTLSELINMCFDNIALGIRAASGGNEPVMQQEKIDISSSCGYHRGK